MFISNQIIKNIQKVEQLGLRIGKEELYSLGSRASIKCAEGTIVPGLGIRAF